MVIILTVMSVYAFEIHVVIKCSLTFFSFHLLYYMYMYACMMIIKFLSC